MAFTSISQVDTSPVQPEHTYTADKALSETQGRYSVDSLEVFVDEVDEGSPSDPNREDVETAITSLTLNGTLGGTEQRNAILENYTEDVVSQTSSIQDIEILDTNSRIQNASVKTESRVEISTNQFNKTLTASDLEPVSDVDDLLLDSYGYSRDINRCEFDSLATKLVTGNSSQGTVRGKAEVKPESLFPSSDEVLITSNVTQFTDTDVQGFAGYFSQVEPDNPGDYNSNYTVGTDFTPSVENQSFVIIKNGLWDSNFDEAITSGCYMPTSHQEAPNIVERINEDSGSENNGVYTVLDPQSSSSDVGFERINGDSGVGIETVSVSGVYPNLTVGSDLMSSEGFAELEK